MGAAATVVASFTRVHLKCTYRNIKRAHFRMEEVLIDAAAIQHRCKDVTPGPILSKESGHGSDSRHRACFQVTALLAVESTDIVKRAGRPLKDLRGM